MNGTEGTLDDRYLEWLYSQVGSVRNRNPSRSFWKLAKQLYAIPFIWFVPNDDNRVADALELREEFLGKEERDASVYHWLDLEVSVFEILIAFARRLSYESETGAVEWFWIFIENLGIEEYQDDLYEIAVREQIDEIINIFIRRLYSSNGSGGLFPLKNPHEDQRHVELWYQAAAYLLENEFADDYI